MLCTDRLNVVTLNKMEKKNLASPKHSIIIEEVSMVCLSRETQDVVFLL